MNAGVATDAQARQLAHEILQRSEYAAWRTSKESPLLGIVMQILRWLNGLLAWITDLYDHRPALYWTLLLALIVVASLLIAHIVVSLRAALRAPRPEPPAEKPEGPSFLEQAELLAAEGRYLEAAHRVHLATIELLLRRRVLELSRSEPNRILRRRLLVARLPEGSRGELLQLLQRLEQRWFRDRSEDRDLYRAWSDLHQRLRASPETA